MSGSNIAVKSTGDSKITLIDLVKINKMIKYDHGLLLHVVFRPYFIVCAISGLPILSSVVNLSWSS